MTREEDVSRLLLSILRNGILRIRAYATHEDTSPCFVEADHIHNLPDLIRSPRLDRLSYYFDFERPAFLKHARGTDVFESDWLRLGELISEIRAEAGPATGDA
jgi:hypothetical protein